MSFVLSLLFCSVIFFSFYHSVSYYLFQDDEEWDDYRENKKDFTGLKIDTLVIEEPAAKPETEETEVRLNLF